MKELRSTVQKTFSLLEHFTADKVEWGVTELAEAVGSNKSTIYRFLSDLQSSGIVYKDPTTEKYSLGLKLFELGNRVNLQSAFVEKTHPPLLEVAQNITETVHIGILHQNQVFCVDKVESPQGLKISTQIGSHNPAYCTAVGKVLLANQQKGQQEQILDNITRNNGGLAALTENTLTKRTALQAELDKISMQGYAIDKEEFEIGLICVAIPIYNQRNETIAALSASGPSSRFREEKVMDYVQILKRGANAITTSIGFFNPLYAFS